MGKVGMHVQIKVGCIPYSIPYHCLAASSQKSAWQPPTLSDIMGLLVGLL